MTRGDGQRGSLMRRPGMSLGRPIGFGGFDPWREMTEMRRQMDQLFSTFFGSPLPASTMTEWPPAAMASGMEPDVDVYDNDKEYIVHAALPGCRPEDINLQATGDSVMLSCEYRSPFESQDQKDNGQNQQAGPTPMRQGRFSATGRYEFSYTFPDEIDPNQISAEFKNGRLELNIPKVQVEGRGKPINIPIQGASTSQPSIAPGKGPKAGLTGAEGNIEEPFVPAGGGQADQRAAHQTKPMSAKTKASRAKAAKPFPS